MLQTPANDYKTYSRLPSLIKVNVTNSRKLSKENLYLVGRVRCDHSSFADLESQGIKVLFTKSVMHYHGGYFSD